MRSKDSSSSLEFCQDCGEPGKLRADICVHCGRPTKLGLQHRIVRIVLFMIILYWVFFRQPLL